MSDQARDQPRDQPKDQPRDQPKQAEEQGEADANTARVRALVAAGDVEAATEEALRAYGGALYGYILGIVGDADAAADALQVCSVRVWQGIKGFAGQSSLKTWLYRVARNAALRSLEDPHRRRAQPLSDDAERALTARWTRTATDAWRQTAEKQRLWASVERLPGADRELLSLRLLHHMSWLEIAAVLEPAAQEATTRAAAAKLRKRFERLKGQLRALLTDPSDDQCEP
jgi:RNA polymerase sigma factor (sigma-70 family)